MKKLCTTLVIAIFCYCSYAQTNTFPLSGNVGIGTTSPSSTLDVNGSIGIRGVPINDPQTISVLSDGTYVVASNWRIKGTYTLSFEASNRAQTVVLLVNANQYDSNSTLSVLSNNSYGGNAVMSNFRLLLSSDGSIVYLVFDAGNRNGGTSISAFFNGNSSYWPSWGGTLPGTATLTGSYPIEVNMGNVGIGTTSPDAKLSVNGTIHTKEVKVDLTGWPDYVFKPKYKLPSLAEVKTYIDQNQHLPGMPSEQEVAKDGINLGEMIKLQTKKIEELTLYLIEKDKQILDQQKVTQSQQEQINEFKQQLTTLIKTSIKN